jgi:hypothetical protein
MQNYLRIRGCRAELNANDATLFANGFESDACGHDLQLFNGSQREFSAHVHDWHRGSNLAWLITISFGKSAGTDRRFETTYSSSQASF